MGPSQRILLLLVFIFFVEWTQGDDHFLKHYTSTGKPCTEICGKQGYNYNWCDTGDDYDYCSVTEFTDYTGKQCKDDHLCGKYGKSYYWCYNKDGSWGYCGLVRTGEPITLSHKSSKYQSECRDECLYDKKYDYFWCNTDDGWDYCSPRPDTTYKNEPCRSDHYCDTHDYEYTWCWTETSYDYCGTVNSGECQYTDSHMYMYHYQNQENVLLSCTHTATRNNFNFLSVSDHTAIAEGGQWRDEITSLITHWNNKYLTKVLSPRLVTTEHLNIAIEGVVDMDGHEFYHLEIQVYPKPKCKETLAQVLVPVQDKVPSRYVRKAFAESFRHRSRIIIKLM